MNLPSCPSIYFEKYQDKKKCIKICFILFLYITEVNENQNWLVMLMWKRNGLQSTSYLLLK